jgi:hypothetical protein
VIGDYLVEYLVLLPWGNREVFSVNSEQ